MDQGRVQFRLSHLFIATTVIAAVTTAAVSCGTVYETDGVVPSVLFPILLGLFLLIPILCLWFRRLRLTSVVAIVVICGLFGFRQVRLIQRLHRLRSEVAEIIKYADAFKADHGSYPTDLSGYEYNSPELKTFLKYTAVDPAHLPPTQSYIPSHPYFHIWFGPKGVGTYGYYYDSDHGFNFEGKSLNPDSGRWSRIQH